MHTFKNTTILEAHAIPDENGRYNLRNFDKLVTPAPFDERSVPHALHKALAQPFSELDPEEQSQVANYLLYGVDHFGYHYGHAKRPKIRKELFAKLAETCE